LVDLGGENVKSLAALASNTPGQSRKAAGDLVTSRKAGAVERVGEDVQKAISPTTDYTGTFDDLVKARSTSAQPLYDRVAEMRVWSPRLQEFADDPIMQEGLNRGLKMLRLEAVARGEKFDPKALGAVIDDAGKVTFPEQPNMRVLDAAKRGIDDILEKYRDPTSGRLRLTPEGRAIEEFRGAYVRVLDELTGGPEGAYAAARKAWGGPTQSMEAMQLGRSILAGDADITAKKIAAMDPSDKEFFRVGVVKALQDKIENTADGRDVVSSFFNKPALRKKLEAAFDSPEEFARFEASMRREMGMASTNNIINPRGGAQTFRLQEGGRDAGIDPIGAFSQFSQGNLLGGVTSLATNAMRGNQGMNSATADALSPLLFATDPVMVREALQRVAGATPKHPGATDAMGAIARALMAPTPSAQAGDTLAPRKPLRIDVRPSDAYRQ
jgi:hypothetical protein